MLSFTSGVNVLASKLVEQWLKIVKDETVPEREMVQPTVVKTEVVLEVPSMVSTEMEHIEGEPLKEEMELEINANSPNKSMEISAQTFYKVTVRDGKQVIHRVENEETVMETVDVKEEVVVTENTTGSVDNKDSKEKTEVKEKKEGEEKKRSSKHHSSSKHKSSSKSSSHSSNKEKSSSSSSRDKHKDREKDRSKDKKHSSRDKEHRSNGQHKSSSHSSSKENKEKQAEKDKATLAKIQPQSINKLGKIPKKSSTGEKEKGKSEKDEHTSSHKHKSSISIEVRKKSDGERPKTVKVFNSKLRSTGLEEAPKPPPSRQAVKKPSIALPAVLPLKRPSPSREAPPPPEKKIKLPEPEEKQEKPGGIKLIPPKPKRKYFLSFDMRLISRLFFRDQHRSKDWNAGYCLVGVSIFDLAILHF